MVEVIILKVPDGTKEVLKKITHDEGFMHMSDLIRDLMRQEILRRRSLGKM